MEPRAVAPSNRQRDVSTTFAGAAQAHTVLQCGGRVGSNVSGQSGGSLQPGLTVALAEGGFAAEADANARSRDEHRNV
eukprot:6007064-Prymnesium_polylepis.1